jgi:hypothetical protein
MVRLKDDGSITAKIIDLGLAKGVNEPSVQTAISTPGAFAGTPEFASPEQIRWNRCGHTVRSVFTRYHALGDGNGKNAISGRSW